MSEANNGHHPFTAENAAIAAPALRKPKRHNAKLCSLAIRERIVNALAAGDSHRAIARSLRVSPNTVRAVIAEKLEREDMPLNERLTKNDPCKHCKKDRNADNYPATPWFEDSG